MLTRWRTEVAATAEGELAIWNILTRLIVAWMRSANAKQRVRLSLREEMKAETTTATPSFLRSHDVSGLGEMAVVERAFMKSIAGIPHGSLVVVLPVMINNVRGRHGTH